MKILVPIKRVPDYATKVKITADSKGIVTDTVKWIINPFDEIAVEESIRLREKGIATEIVVMTTGTEDCIQQLRQALAMGADRAILVKYDGYVDSDCAAHVIAKIFELEKDVKLILLGKQAVDTDSNQTPQLLASYLNLSQASFASQVLIASDKATVTREVDGGLETLCIPLPCIVSTDLRLNEPRYASLPNIMKAKKKPVDTIEISQLGVATDPKIVVKKLSYPPKKQAGVKVQSFEDLVKIVTDKI